jgi:acetyl-CoA carboxylase carboxyl transferase subunit beta
LSERLSARELLDLVLDEGSFVSWDVPPDHGVIAETYAAQLQSAQQRTGLDECVVTGEGLLRSRRVAVIVVEFDFMGGSIGVASALRIVAAVERATAQRLPLLAAPASSGTRMQEGTLAFVKMVKVSSAIARHKASGLPYLVYLRHPTTGGVLASWGSLGHVTAAEPHALIGFLGPRVYEALYERPFPSGVQTAENLYHRGLIDAVVPPDCLAHVLDRTLGILLANRDGQCDMRDPSSAKPRLEDGWDAVISSRRRERPGIRELLRCIATSFVPLSGTGHGERDPALLIALARIGSLPCVVLGQDRRFQAHDSRLGPGGLREARRAMHLAAELRLPLVTVIDTPGLALSVEAEEGGTAGEIAGCLADLVTLRTPTLAILLGEGTGGGALALLPADKVVAAQNAWLAPLPPEGASAIAYRDIRHAPEMARAQQVSSTDLLNNGIVDRIVAEMPDAADEPVAFCMRLGEVLRYELAALLQRNVDDLVTQRYGRF